MQGWYIHVSCTISLLAMDFANIVCLDCLSFLPTLHKLVCYTHVHVYTSVTENLNEFVYASNHN